MFTPRQSISALLFAVIATGTAQASDLREASPRNVVASLASQSVLEVSRQVAAELSMDVLHDVHTASHQFETDAENEVLMAEVKISSY